MNLIFFFGHHLLLYAFQDTHDSPVNDVLNNRQYCSKDRRILYPLRRIENILPFFHSLVFANSEFGQYIRIPSDL